MKRKTLITSVVLASAATAAIPLSIVLSAKVKESTSLDEKVHTRWGEIENELATSLGGFDVRSQDDVTRYEDISQEAKVASVSAYKELEGVVGYNERGGYFVDANDIQTQKNTLTDALNTWAKSLYGDESNKSEWIQKIKDFAALVQININQDLDGYKALAHHFNVSYDTNQHAANSDDQHLIHFTDINDQSTDDEVIYEAAKLFMEGLIKKGEHDKQGVTTYWSKHDIERTSLFLQETNELPIEVILYRFLQDPKINRTNISYDIAADGVDIIDQLWKIKTADEKLANLENPFSPPEGAFDMLNTIAYNVEGSDGGFVKLIRDSGHSIINPFAGYDTNYAGGENMTARAGVDAYLSELIYDIADYHKDTNEIKIKPELNKLGLDIDVQKRSLPITYNNNGQNEQHTVYDLKSISFTKDGVTKKWAPEGLKMYITLNKNDGINAVVLENWDSWINMQTGMKSTLDAFKNLVKPELYDIDKLIEYIAPKPADSSSTSSTKTNDQSLQSKFTDWWNANGPTLFGLNEIVDVPEISPSLVANHSFQKMLDSVTSSFTVVTNQIGRTFRNIATSLQHPISARRNVAELAKTYLISKSRVFASNEWLRDKDYVLSLNINTFNSVVRKYNLDQESIKIYITNSYWGNVMSEMSTNVISFVPNSYEKSYDFPRVFGNEAIDETSLEDYALNKKEMVGWKIASLGQGQRLHLTNDSVIKFELSLDKNLKGQALNNEQARLPQLFELNDIGELYDL